MCHSSTCSSSCSPSWSANSPCCAWPPTSHLGACFLFPLSIFRLAFLESSSANVQSHVKPNPYHYSVSRFQVFSKTQICVCLKELAECAAQLACRQPKNDLDAEHACLIIFSINLWFSSRTDRVVTSHPSDNPKQIQCSLTKLGINRTVTTKMHGPHTLCYTHTHTLFLLQNIVSSNARNLYISVRRQQTNAPSRCTSI